MVAHRLALGALSLATLLSCALDRAGVNALQADVSAAGGSSTGGAAPSVGGGEAGAGAAGGGGGTSPMPSCGDGDDDPDEECDDGNHEPLDGCSATCTVENRDDCATAPVVPIGASPVNISGDTTGANDTVDEAAGPGECTAGSYPGPDHVFLLLPQMTGTMMATLDADYPNHSLHARDACPGRGHLDCSYGEGVAENDIVSFPVTAGQIYFVLVDSWAGGEGGYELTVELVAQ